MSRWSFFERLCFIIYNHMLTSLFPEMWARSQGLWFLIISENNWPGPQQQRSKVLLDPTPRTKTSLSENVKHRFVFFFSVSTMIWCDAESTCSSRRDTVANVGGRRDSDETTNALYVSFSKCQSASCWIRRRKWSIWERIKGSGGWGKGGVSPRLPLSSPKWLNF